MLLRFIYRMKKSQRRKIGNFSIIFSACIADNPVLCDPGLADLTVALEVNHAKVYGVANDCPTTASTPTEQTSPLPPLPATLLLAAAAAAASGGNVSFAATLE